MQSLKQRNNARTNLGLGLEIGFRANGVSPKVVPDETELLLGIGGIPPDADLVLIPYWISRKLFEMNIGDVKAVAPGAMVATYTGVGPFWDGCDWVSYRPSSRSLHPDGLTARELGAFKAVDRFFVVTSRRGVCPAQQAEVGMGVFDELTPGTKSPFPMVVVDAMKAGWDEDQYEAALDDVATAIAAVPGTRVICLDANPLVARRIPGALSLPVHNRPWDQVIATLKSAWAYVVHNESFGYTVVESMACGTRVFCHPTAEMPACHSCLPSGALADILRADCRLSAPARDARALEIAQVWRQEHPALCDWPGACRRILDICKERP